MAVLSVVTASLVVAVAGPAHAAAITVTTDADELNVDGGCSLREAILAANTNLAVDASARRAPAPT